MFLKNMVRTNTIKIILCCISKPKQPEDNFYFANGGDASLDEPAKTSKSGSGWEGPRSTVPRHIPSPKEDHCYQIIWQILLISRGQESMQQAISLLA